MVKLLEQLTHRLVIALMAFSLILSFSLNGLIGHAEAARNVCDKASQVAGTLESQALKITFNSTTALLAADDENISAGAKAPGSTAVQGGCCNYFCASSATVPPCSFISIPHFEIADWPLNSRALSPVSQDGLKRPPRQSGNI
jgi:hypothetical protein